MKKITIICFTALIWAVNSLSANAQNLKAIEVPEYQKEFPVYEMYKCITTNYGYAINYDSRPQDIFVFYMEDFLYSGKELNPEDYYIYYVGVVKETKGDYTSYIPAYLFFKRSNMSLKESAEFAKVFIEDKTEDK